MATETVLSTFITDRDSNPQATVPKGYGPSRLTHVQAVVTMGVYDVLSKYKMFSIPSSAVPVSLKLSQDTVAGGSTALKISLYQTTLHGGAVVQDAYFGTGIDVHTTALNGSEILHSNSSLYTLASCGKAIWQLMSTTPLYSDPCTEYDVYLMTSTACTSNGCVLKLEMTYK